MLHDAKLAVSIQWNGLLDKAIARKKCLGWGGGANLPLCLYYYITTFYSFAINYVTWLSTITGLDDWTTGLISKIHTCGLKTSCIFILELSLNRVLEVPPPPPPPPKTHGLHDHYLTGLERATNTSNHAVALPNSAKGRQLPLHAPCMPHPMLSHCSANVQPMLSQCPANVQPKLRQCPAYAQPKPSSCSQPMLSQSPAYAQPMSSLYVQPMPSLCSIA